MYYEINVSRLGRHYFATAERSITTKRDAQDMYWHFKRLFSEDFGYQITVTECVNSGKDVTLDMERPLEGNQGL